MNRSRANFTTDSTLCHSRALTHHHRDIVDVTLNHVVNYVKAMHLARIARDEGMSPLDSFEKYACSARSHGNRELTNRKHGLILTVHSGTHAEVVVTPLLDHLN